MSSAQDILFQRLAAAERKAAKNENVVTVPKYHLAVSGSLVIDAYQFTTYGACYEVRKDINSGDTITVDLSDTPDIIYADTWLMECTNLKFGTPTGTPWQDDPFGGSTAYFADSANPEDYIYSGEVTPAFTGLFATRWTGTTDGIFRAFLDMYDFRNIEYTSPITQGLFGTQPLQEEHSIDHITLIGNRAPHAGWTFENNWVGGVPPNAGINKNFLDHPMSFTRSGYTIVKTIATPSAHGNVPFMGSGYSTNVFDITATRNITAPNALILLCLAFSLTPPTTDAEKYPVSITDNGTSSGPTNRLNGRASESLIGPLRTYLL